MIRGVQAVKARSEPKTTFFCLSNSNSVFIDTILRVSNTPPRASPRFPFRRFALTPPALAPAAPRP